MSKAEKAESRSSFRVIAASFVAGAGAMTLAGLVAPVALKGGLSIRDAMAATVTDEHKPLIEPVDVAAVNAQLAKAERDMSDARAATDETIARLDRLSGR